MGGLLIDRLYSPREVIISDMDTHMAHINHNIELNSGEFGKHMLYLSTFYRICHHMLFVSQLNSKF